MVLTFFAHVWRSPAEASSTSDISLSLFLLLSSGRSSREEEIPSRRYALRLQSYAGVHGTSACLLSKLLAWLIRLGTISHLLCRVFGALSVFYSLVLHLTLCISDFDASNASVVEINNNNYSNLSPRNYSFKSKICVHFKEFLVIQTWHLFSAKSRITNAMIQRAEQTLRKLIKCVDCFMKKLQAYESLTLCN